MPNAKFPLVLLLIASTSLVLPAVATAKVTLPPVLSSHMVLQRDMPLPIWGTAAPGEKVTVSFRGQEKSATADPQGKWLVKLDPLKAGGPDVMKIVGTDAITLDDVLVGEVWVGSGQSNMAGGTGRYTKNDEVLGKLASATYPKLRLKSSGNQGWQEATPQNIERFSALLFAFGAPLQQNIDVPVGLMVGAVGGTPSGFWLSQEAFESDPACKALVETLKAADKGQAQKNYEQALAKWEKDCEAAKQKGERRMPRKPAPQAPGECNGKIGNLYEGHIRPYIPYGIRGVLWDQGESGTAISGVDQYTLMGALIKGWRKEWGQPPASVPGGPATEFPFVYVQKPSGGGCAWDPADPVTSKAEAFCALPESVPGDGDYRTTHIRIMTYPNTFMAISSDLGSGVHPVNKSGYGARAARVALGAVYGKNVEIYGPVYKSHTIEAGKVIVSFDHVGKGLAVKKDDSRGQGKLQGFAVAGEDGKFVWADAAIDGDKVVVSSDKVSKPAAVSYAWAAKHPWANLFNKDGLPAVPFKTDAPGK